MLLNGLCVCLSAFVLAGKTNKCSLSLLNMGSWKSSFPLSYTVIGKAE